MNDMKAMLDKLSDDMPVVMEEGGVLYSVSKQEYIAMLKKMGVV
jgi:chaperonin cofactor prefoldin